MDNIDLQTIFDEIDAVNSQDPNIEIWQGQSYPKEILYSMRMNEYLENYFPRQSAALKIAARAQHIGRWKIQRDEFPMDRKGYLQWRTRLKQFHAEEISSILTSCSASKELINRCQALILKKNLKRDPEVQILEDVVCLVFIRFYLQPFSVGKTDEKMIDILSKTWVKMSNTAQQFAMSIPLDEVTKQLLTRALADNS